MEPDNVTYDHHGRVYHFAHRKYRSVTSVLKALEDDSRFRFAASKHNKVNPDYPWHIWKDDSALCGDYLHYVVGCDMARECRLPKPPFDIERPFPNIAYIGKKGEERDRFDDYELALGFWDMFKEDVNPHIVGSGLERFVYDDEEEYAGRVDSVMKLDTKKLQEKFEEYCQGGNFNYALKGKARDGDVWLVDFKSSRAIYDDYPAQVWAYMIAWNKMFPQYKCNRMAILRMNGETGWEFIETFGDPDHWQRALAAAREQGRMFRPHLQIAR